MPENTGSARREKKATPKKATEPKSKAGWRLLEFIRVMMKRAGLAQ